MLLHGRIDQHRQALQVLRTDDDVDSRRPFQDRVTFLLRDATGDRDDRPLPDLDRRRAESLRAA